MSIFQGVITVLSTHVVVSTGSIIGDKKTILARVAVMQSTVALVKSETILSAKLSPETPYQ